MTRCFIGVDVPQDIADTLAEAQERLHGSYAMRASFSDPQQLHVTLAFLGDLNEEQIEEIAAELEGVERESFPTEVLGVEMHKQRVIWAALSPEGWQELHDAVAEVLPTYAPKGPRFRPHVTLARLKDVRDASAVRSLVRSLAVPDVAFKVSRFYLYSSRLTGDGPVYAQIQGYDLA